MHNLSLLKKLIHESVDRISASKHHVLNTAVPPIPTSGQDIMYNLCTA